MEKIFTDFGVQPVLIAAQIVNFIILLLILKRFLYKPLFKVIEERRKVVSESLSNSEKIELRLQSVEDESAQKLSVVTEEAQKILDAATRNADEIIQQAHQRAQIDIELMLETAKHNLTQERKRIEREMRDEFAKLVIFGIEKTAGKVLEQSDHQKIIDQQLNDLQNHKEV